MSDEHVHAEYEKDALLTILSETENLTNVGGWEWDAAKDNWSFSDNWLRIHGCSKRHLVTSELLQIAHPDDRHYVHKAFNSAIAEGNNYEIEHRIVRQDTGEVRSIRAHGKSILNSEGKVVKIYGAAQDITEFRQTEKKLRESEDKIENIVNNLPGVAYQFLLDKEGTFHFKYMGNNCIKLFGIKASAILSDANLVFDLIPQPDADEVQKKIKESAETLTSYDIEHRVIKRNGETVWVHAISTPWKNGDGDIVWDGIGLDITKRRQAEKALEKKNHLLKRITENMFDMVSMSDIEGNYTFAGKSHERILGYATSDLIGKNVMDFVHPDDLPTIKKEFQSLLEKGGTKTVQYRNRHNLGHYLWFETIGELLLDKNQNPSEIIFSTRDISEHKKVQAVLEEKEQRYKSAQRMGKVGNWEYDLLNDNFWGSDEAKRIYGFDNESHNFTVDQVESCIPDREKVHQALVDLIEKNKPYDLEFKILPINQSEMRIIKSIAEVVKNGSDKPQKVIGVIQDITDQRLIDEKLRKSEQRYRRLTENSPDMIYRMSLPDGKYEYVSKAAEKIFGYPPEIWYKNPLLIQDLLAPEFHSYFNREWENLLKGHISPTYEYKIRHKDKKERWINQRNILVRDDTGLPIAIEGVVSDITEHKQSDEALQESEQKFRILFESSKDANYISNVEGHIIEANQSFLELFDYDKEELKGLRTQDLYVNPKDRTAFINEVERGGFTKDFEETLKDKKGKVIECHTNATFRRSADGTIIGYQGIIRDVTDNKRKQIEREKLILELQEALAEVKTLSGLLPICSHCKKIRDDKGYWTQLESYIHQHSEAVFSHGICQECAQKYYPDLDIYDD